MANGVQTYDAQGNTLLYSPDMSGIFYNNAGIYNTTASLPITGFAQVSAISTPVQTPSYNWNGSTGVYSAQVSATGSISYSSSFQVGASGYTAPQTIENSGNNCYIVTPALNNISTQIYNFGTPVNGPPPGDYGMQVPGRLNGVGPSPITYFVSIDSTYKAYYIQPGPDGQPLRTNTCTSIPSQYGSSISSYQVPTGSLTGQTIYFEKAFVNPPLIFVTEATGPIALHYMSKNSAGLYDGMVVVAASSPSTQGLAGTSWYTPNTYSFTYFLISDEEPLYKAQAAYGIQVFNGNGTKVFDSSYLCSNFTIQTAGYQPFFKLTSAYTNPGCGYTGSVLYQTFQRLGYYIDPPKGICLNNINSIKGHTTYSSIYLGSGSPSSGPTTFWGHYLTLKYDPAYGHNVAWIEANGANGIFMSPTFNAPGWGNSWEYFDHTQPTSFLVANYAF